MSPPSSPNRTPGYTPNVFTGVALAISRFALFANTKKIAISLFVLVFFTSMLPTYWDLEKGNYFTQKHNIFNQYGVKLGWFWTLVTIGPFIYITSTTHDAQHKRLAHDLGRLGVATGFWYFVTKIFHTILERTSYCYGALSMSREKCGENNGVWTPGFDISGHIFLMVYSMLIMHEEAKSFERWNELSKSPRFERAEGKALFAKQTRTVTYAFLALSVLSAAWFGQIIISCLYYHFLLDKVLAAIVAILSWHVTYNVLYRSGLLLRSPIHRKSSRV